VNPPKHRRQWRFYKTEKGNCPVRKFLDGLTDDDAAEIVAEMKLVEAEGLKEARHLDGEIYEVRASGKDVIAPYFVRQGGSLRPRCSSRWTASIRRPQRRLPPR